MRTIKTIYLARNHSTSHFGDCSKPSEPSISEKRRWSLNIAASHWVFLCVCLCLSVSLSVSPLSSFLSPFFYFHPPFSPFSSLPFCSPKLICFGKLSWSNSEMLSTGCHLSSLLPSWWLFWRLWPDYVRQIISRGELIKVTPIPYSGPFLLLPRPHSHELPSATHSSHCGLQHVFPTMRDWNFWNRETR